MRPLIALLLMLLFMPAVRAQVNFSINNLFRYGEGREYRGGEEPEKQYIENQTNVRLFWKDFTIGFRYLYDNPPEFGPTYRGVKKRYVEYAQSGLEVRAGDYYTLYGRGLSMNLFENRGLNYDTGLDGIRARYNGEMVNAILSFGTFDFYDILDPNRTESYSLKSGNVEFKPWKFLELGGSFVHADGLIPDDAVPVRVLSDISADIPEVNIHLRQFGLDLFASYANKRSTIDRRSLISGEVTDTTHSGEGFYGSLSYASDEGFGITVEYKDYRFDVVNQRERRVTRDTRILPFQNPPVVFKEHSFTLLTRTPHIIDFNDEIGMQVDAFYQPTPSVTLNLNGSIASRHQRYRTIPQTYTLAAVEEVVVFPSLDNEFAPFWEIYCEGEWYFTDDSYLRLALNRRYDVTNDSYDFANDRAEIHTVASTTVPARLEYAMGGGYSLAGDVEYQRVHDSQLIDASEYSTLFLALTLTRAPDWALTARLETTDNEFEPSGRSFWAAGEITHRLGNAHTVSASYGSERGGLICASGICRQVNPFNGFRLTILTQW